MGQKKNNDERGLKWRISKKSQGEAKRANDKRKRGGGNALGTKRREQERREGMRSEG